MLITTIFAILLITMAINVIWVGVKLAWCIWKWLLALVLLPGTLVVMAVGGLMMLALPLLLAAGLAILIAAKPVLPEAVFWAGIVLLILGLLVVTDAWLPFSGTRSWMV